MNVIDFRSTDSKPLSREVDSFDFVLTDEERSNAAHAQAELRWQAMQRNAKDSGLVARVVKA